MVFLGLNVFFWAEPKSHRASLLATQASFHGRKDRGRVTGGVGRFVDFGVDLGDRFDADFATDQCLRDALADLAFDV